jgi:selenocysteine lyase/cysteine desulfurase
VLGLGAAIDYALHWGIDEIAARIDELAGMTRAGLSGIPGVIVRDRGIKRTGIVTFTHDRIPAAELVEAIKGSRINVSLSTPDYALHDFERNGVDGLVRVSPHVYNLQSELDQFLEVVAAA